ncbi:hypothetical protein SEA_ARCHIE_54 [Mycobacterium phage Archie]|uniref:Uncharacterized protein n=1 Tax=Mycobacterium phage Archie TaxID=1718599 RepID=A0A0M4QZU7_9CAUD|nr:hypothetical protein AVU85_gp054 [Mycobacterium phage Archie]ALF00360.1 hypothetical protein SEA_ARCHIE_54 [Mycobacterium phage Archie]
MALFKKSVPVVAPPKSVASITAGLSDTLAELEAHADDQAEQVSFQNMLAAQARNAAKAHEVEHDKARKIAGNIKALLDA